MSILDVFRRRTAPVESTAARAPDSTADVRADAGQIGPGKTFSGFDDPALLEYIRMGQDDGDYGRRIVGLRNMSVLRCTSLICNSIGMLPANLIENTPEKPLSLNHPVYRLMRYRPNGYQTPSEFKSQLQLNVLEHGRAYARIVRSLGRPIGLYPMDPLATLTRLTNDWQLVHEYTPPNGQTVVLAATDVLYIRDLSADGVQGISRMRMAREALHLARELERAAQRVASTGVMAGGALEFPKELSDAAYARMQASLSGNYSGPENAGKWMVVEEGGKANKFANTANDAQQIQNRQAQIEEVARAFGVPRPLLMMDDTSWGSGIEQLGIFFIQYCLQPWLNTWEEALERALLDESELGQRFFKFDERELLRGTLNDQATFLFNALGGTGGKGWMTQNDARDMADLPKSSSPGADDLNAPPPSTSGDPNEPA